MQQYELKIPKERIAILIGEKGKIKKGLEEKTKTKIEIDSKEGDVFIKGEDSLQAYNLNQVIKAIARGFNPKIAELLLKENYVLEVVNIEDYTKGSQKKRVRLKGRVIGEKGKSRETIERLTKTYISVYGKTIAILGEGEYAALARKAVEDLLRGAKHGPIFKSLEINKKELLRREFEHGEGK